MKPGRYLYLAIPVVALTAAVAGYAIWNSGKLSDPKYRAAARLQAFDSTREAAEFIFRHRELHRKLDQSSYPVVSGDGVLEEVIVSGIRASLPETITNNQEAGVDEGGIVKRAGRYLVVLRRGRLYSLDIGEHTGASLRKVAQIDVAPATWKHDAWYDELLIHGDTVLVIGFNFELDCSELSFFKLHDDGQLTYATTYLIPSSDYYDPENYAGRLVDGNLVVYLPDTYLNTSNVESIAETLSPSAARVGADGQIQEQYPLFTEHRIFRPVQHSKSLSMFTAVVCPLKLERFACSARSILTDHVDGHYVSPNAVYMWGHASGWAVDIERTPARLFERAGRDGSYDELRREMSSVVYRFPLDSDGIEAVKAIGEPLNQFSFMEKNNRLYLFGRMPEGEYGYFTARHDAGKTFWAEVPLSLFAETTPQLPEDNIHWLPDLTPGERISRFIGDYIVYTSTDWDDENTWSQIAIGKLEAGAEPVVLQEDFYVSKIEPLGADALLMGEKGEDETVLATLQISAHPVTVDRLSKFNSIFAESRSHGFNYRPLEQGGMFGLPLFVELTPERKEIDGDWHEAEPAVNMLYFGVDPSLSLYEMGELAGSREIQWHNWDDCDVSCEDWYGSSRPFFIGERIFALLKNELVEGYLSSHSVHEKQRVDMLK